MIPFVVFGGKNLRDFGVIISGTRTYGAPARVVSYETVKGRNGDLIIDDGVYENVEVTYTAMIHDDFARNIRDLRNYLLSVKGYARLEDCYNPDTYCLASYANAIEFEAKGFGNSNGEIDITFNRKPQRFLKTGETQLELTATGTIYNPTDFDSFPMIRVYGHGDLTINGTVVSIGGTTPYVDLDCELQNASYGSTNMNNYITLTPYDFPYFVAGNNSLTVGNGITKVIVTPKWWHL